MKKTSLPNIKNSTQLFIVLSFISAIAAQSAFGAIQVGGQLLLDLHTSRGMQTNSTGAVLGWTNYGTIPGYLAYDGSTSTAPTNNNVGGENCVTFDGAERLKANFVSPNLLTGYKPGNIPEDYTIEYWVYNPAVANEEWILTLARRGTSPRFGGFGYGTSGSFGATAHWGEPDMAFGEGISTAGAASTPPAGYWHHIVITYDGTTERAYTNGVLNAQEGKALNLWDGDPLTVGSTYESSFAYSSGINYSGSIKALRVHSGALTAEQVLNNYNEGIADMGLVPCQVAALSATSIWITNANFNGLLVAPAEPTDVTVYYGTSDVKTNKTQWGASLYLGQLGAGSISTNITGLNFGTLYYYRMYASNSVGEAWSMATNFYTLGLASIANLPAKTVLPTSARLRGNLSNTNGSPTQVKVYWGISDGGTDPASWANVADLGIQPVGEQAAKVSGLTPGMTYFYKYYAVNAAGETWASGTQTFTTPPLFNSAGFAYNMQITFSGYSKAQTLTNFPALVVLNSSIPNFDYAFFLLDAADLRFVDETGGELNYEIETWDPTGSSYVWVQVPELAIGTAIQAFWGKADLSVPAYTTNGATWSDGFAAVWHMTNRLPVDSTGHNWNAISNRNPNAVLSTAGVIGNGQDFITTDPGGSAGTIVIGNGGDIDLTTQTLSAWVWLRDANREGAFMAKDGVMFFWQQGTVLRFETASWGGDTTIPNPPTGTWIHFVATASGNGSVQRIYTNGVLSTGPWTKGAPVLNNNPFTIGGGYAGNNNRNHNGKLDECRAENIDRSADWIWACWKNQSAPSQFMTLSPVVLLGAPLAVNLPSATSVGMDAATLKAKVVSDGGNGVSSWGTVWGTSPAPIDNFLPIDGAANAPLFFSQARTGFTPGTHYYFRGFASNAVEGIVYSPDGEFYTVPESAADLTFSAIGDNSMTLSWTPPANYSGFLVIMREATAVTAVPVSGLTYPPNPIFERGFDFGSGQYVVYAGSEPSVTVSGLVPGATYYATVYTFAGTGNLTVYQTATPATGSVAAANIPGFGIAGQLLIDINVTRGLEVNESGQVTNWINYGTVRGAFLQDGDVSTCPTYTTVQGIPAVSFNPSHLKANFSAPPEITGVDALGKRDDYTLEAWVLNPAIAAEEWIFSWAWRGTENRCAALGYGSHGTWGVLGQWGAGDVGFAGVPGAGVWHHIVATYDGTNNVIYVDGVLNNTKATSLNLWDGGPCVLGDQYVMPFGYANLPYSGYLSTLRIHSRCMTAQQVAINYTAGPLDPFTPVSITRQPVSRIVGEHENVTFSVVSAGEPVIGYQWYRKGTIVEGATAQEYTCYDVTMGDSGSQVFVVCSNFSGGNSYVVTSDVATVTVMMGNDALMHRYSFNGDARDSVGGADGILMIGATNDGSKVFLDGTNGYVDLPNDLFTNYVSMTVEAWATDDGSSGWARLWDFGNSSAEGVQGGASSYMFFAWPNGGNSGVRGCYKTAGSGEQYLDSPTKPAVGVQHHIVWTQDGLGGVARIYVDGVLAATLNGITYTPASVGPTFNNWLGRSQYVDPYFKGSIDEVRIYNLALSSNQVSSSYLAGPDAVISIGPAQFQTQPRTQTVGEFADASFSVLVRGEAPVSYQWYHNDTPVTDATNNSLPFVGAQISDSGSQFYCVVSNSALGNPYVITSVVATLTVVQADTSLTHRYSFTSDATDSIGGADGNIIGGLITSNMLQLRGITNDYVQLPAGIIDGYSALTIEFWIDVGVNGIWSRVYDFGDQNADGTGHHYMFFSPHTGNNDVRMSIADGDPTGNTHEQAAAIPGVLDGLGMMHVACVYDPPNGVQRLYTNGVLASSSAISIPLSRITSTLPWIGRSLYNGDNWFNGYIDEFRIYNSALSSPKVLQSYQQGPQYPLVNSTLAIVGQPQTQVAELCSTVTLSVRAGSIYPLTYQWYWLDFPVSDATNADYVIENAQDYLAGDYYVVVTNSVGSLPSEIASLSFVDTTPPVIAACTNASVTADNTCQALVPDLTGNVLATDCTGLVVTQAPLPGESVSVGEHTITFTVTDPVNNASICTATLTVTDPMPPEITTEPQDVTVLQGTAVTLTIAGTSCGPMGIQWYHGATLVPDASTGSLTILNLQEVTAGEYTAVLSNSAGSTTSRVAMVTLNRPPVAQTDGAATVTNQPLTISASALLSNDSDPDSDPLTVVSVTSPSANGGTVSLVEGQVTFTPAADFSGIDRFSYTISDGRGGTATTEVQVNVVQGTIPAVGHVEFIPSAPNTRALRFHGVPGTSYRFVYNSDLGDSWTTLLEVVCPLHGIIEAVDDSPDPAKRFYRVVTP